MRGKADGMVHRLFLHLIFLFIFFKQDCGLKLSTEAEGKGCYPLDDHILCKNCNAKRVQKLTSGIQKT